MSFLVFNFNFHFENWKLKTCLVIIFLFFFFHSEGNFFIIKNLKKIIFLSLFLINQFYIIIHVSHSSPKSLYMGPFNLDMITWLLRLATYLTGALGPSNSPKDL